MGFLKSWLGRGPGIQVCHPGILCEPLEERIVLNAAVAVANQDHTDQTSHVQTQDVTQTVGTPAADQNHVAGAPADTHTSENLGQVTQNDLHVVLVSNALDHLQGISHAAKDGTRVVVLDDASSNLASVDRLLGDLVSSTGQKIGKLAILSHGNDGLITLGSDQITLLNLNSFRSEFQQLSTLMAPGAQIQLYECSVAGDGLGKVLVNDIAAYTGANLFASTGEIGATGENWVLGYSTNPAVTMQIIMDSNHLPSLDNGLAAPYPAFDNTWGVSMNGYLYFMNDDGIHGTELWRVSATGLPSMVADINPGAAGSNPAELTVFDGVLYFGASDGNGQGSHGTELWRTDGTAAGTYLVTDLNPGGNKDSNPHGLTVSNGSLYFAATDGNGSGSHGTELFKTDGTAANTVLVADINPGQADSNPAHLTDVNGILYFSATDGNNSRAHGTELWRSDGTAAGTYTVADIYSGNKDSNPDQLTNVNGTLFFSASDGNNAASHGTELWSSDGTAKGTHMVADINPGNGDSHPTALTNVNGTVYFAADDGTHGNELWSSDGTAAGTQMIKDINPGNHDSNPTGLLNINGTVYFAADDGSHGNELWSTNGTAAGTQIVKDISPGSNSSTPHFFNNYNGALIFAADDGTHGYEPWKSDGTAAGTFLMKDINPNGSSFPLNFARLNPLFFLADDGHGFKLWKTDGTVAGTVQVSDVSTGSIVASTLAGTVPTPGDAPGGTPGSKPGTETSLIGSENPDGSTGKDTGSFAQNYIVGDKLKDKGFFNAIGKALFPLFSTSDVTAEGEAGSNHASPKIKAGAGQAESFPSFANLESAGSLTSSEQPGGNKTTSDTAHDQNGHASQWDQPLPGTIKVIVLENGDYSVRTDLFTLVVGAEVWVPPIVKWYLAALSEGRYRPGSLPAGFERMMWDFLQYTATRKAETHTPVPEFELRLAWQWAEWRRQVSKTQGSVDALPWNYFQGLSEAMMLFYGGAKDGHVDFSQAVSAMQQNIRNLTIIPVKLPEELHSRAPGEPLPR